jgi:hypothetical protein
VQQIDGKGILAAKDQKPDEKEMFIYTGKPGNFVPIKGFS